MDRPLWQIFLHILLLAFAIQRGAATVMLHMAGADVVTTVTFGAQTLFALAASAGVFIGGRAAIRALIALGAAMGLGAVVLGFVSRAVPAPAAIAQIFVALLATSALVFVMRRESRS
jgi:hypothetical protein